MDNHIFFKVFFNESLANAHLKMFDNPAAHFARLWTFSDLSRPVLKLFLISVIAHSPETTYSKPHFLLRIRIKHRELVLKAARIAPLASMQPHWWKNKPKFNQNHEIRVLHCTCFRKKQMRIYESLKQNAFLAYLKLWYHSKIVDLVIAVRTVPLTPLET